MLSGPKLKLRAGVKYVNAGTDASMDFQATISSKHRPKSRDWTPWHLLVAARLGVFVPDGLTATETNKRGGKNQRARGDHMLPCSSMVFMNLCPAEAPEGSGF